LNALKARMELGVALACTRDPEQLAAIFAETT
jgi:hypothetical protein